MIKKIVIMTFALLSTSCLALTPNTHSLPQPIKSAQELNRVIATVNGDPITQHQFDVFYDQSLRRLKAQNQPLPSASEMRQYLLNQLIDRRLQIQMANRGGIHVSEKQVEQQIELIRKQKNMTLSQLKEYLQTQGYNYPDFQNEVRTEILIGQLQHAALASQISITQEDVAAEYQKIEQDPRFSSQYHLVDILVPLSDKPTDEQVEQAKKTALALKMRLQKGAPYQAISANNTTDLGWRTVAELPTVFAEVVPTLKVGGVAGPLRAENGFHVIEVLNIRKSKVPRPPLREVQEHLYMMKVQGKMAEWMKNLRKQSDIQIYDEPQS